MASKSLPVCSLRIVEMCVAAGLVDGTHQSIDSTLVKANASLDSLERKTPELTVTEYIKQTTQEIHEEKQNTQDSPEKQSMSTDTVISNTPVRQTPTVK